MPLHVLYYGTHKQQMLVFSERRVDILPPRVHFTGDTSLLCFNATFTTSQCNVKWTMYTMVVSSLLGSTLDVFGHIRTLSYALETFWHYWNQTIFYEMFYNTSFSFYIRGILFHIGHNKFVSCHVLLHKVTFYFLNVIFHDSGVVNAVGFAALHELRIYRIFPLHLFWKQPQMRSSLSPQKLC